MHRQIRWFARVLVCGLVCGLACALYAVPRAWCEEPSREVVPQADAKARSKEEAKALVSAMKSKDPDLRAQAAEDSATNQDRSLTSPLVRLLSDKEDDVRLMAFKALSVRDVPAARKKASSAVVSRLPRLAQHAVDRPELLVAIDALGKLGQPSAIKPLLDPIDVEMDIEEVRARINAVAAIPEAESIERLIQFLAKGRRGGRKQHRDAAEKALRWATGVRLGRDPDKWRAWWRENKKAFSFEALAEEREASERKKREQAERRKKQKQKRKNKGKGGKKNDGGKPQGPTD